MPAPGHNGATATTVQWQRINPKVSQRNSSADRSADILACMTDLSDFYGLDVLLNDDEQMIRDTVKKFVDNEFKPLVAEHFEAGTFPMELVPTIADMGLLGMHLEGYGCAGASAMAYGIACRELEAGDSASGVSCQYRARCACSRFGNTGQRNKKSSGCLVWRPAKSLAVSV